MKRKRNSTQQIRQFLNGKRFKTRIKEMVELAIRDGTEYRTEVGIETGPSSLELFLRSLSGGVSPNFAPCSASSEIVHDDDVVGDGKLAILLDLHTHPSGGGVTPSIDDVEVLCKIGSETGLIPIGLIFHIADPKLREVEILAFQPRTILSHNSYEGIVEEMGQCATDDEVLRLAEERSVLRVLHMGKRSGNPTLRPSEINAILKTMDVRLELLKNLESGKILD
jgi:hypothetical protein